MAITTHSLESNSNASPTAASTTPSTIALNCPPPTSQAHHITLIQVVTTEQPIRALACMDKTWEKKAVQMMRNKKTGLMKRKKRHLPLNMNSIQKTRWTTITSDSNQVRAEQIGRETTIMGTAQLPPHNSSHNNNNNEIRITVDRVEPEQVRIVFI
jgi:hypothetical protein